MTRRSSVDLAAELRVDIARFPYSIYLGERKVAVLFTHTLVGAISNTIKYFERTNELIREYNLLVDALKGRGDVNLEELKYKRLLEIPKDDGDDFFKAYGVAVGQVWKTKGSYHHYEITEINQTQTTVFLHWIGPFKYLNELSVEALKKRYELIPSANKVLILRITEIKQGYG